MRPKYIKRLQAQSRALRAYLAEPNMVIVESMSNPDAHHKVCFRFEADGTIRTRCTCEWAANRGVACSHVMAALEYLAGLKQRTLSFWVTREEATRQKRRLFRLQNGDDDTEAIWITSRAA